MTDAFRPLYLKFAGMAGMAGIFRQFADNFEKKRSAAVIRDC